MEREEKMVGERKKGRGGRGLDRLGLPHTWASTYTVEGGSAIHLSGGGAVFGVVGTHAQWGGIGGDTIRLTFSLVSPPP